MARWHAEHYMMRVEQQIQVSDVTHGVLAFNISGGCGAAGGTSSQRLAWLPTIDVRGLAFVGALPVWAHLPSGPQARAFISGRALVAIV